jgi:hypothetical protein
LRLLQSAISNGSAHLAHPKENGAPGDAVKWGWRKKPGATEEEVYPMGDCIGWAKAPHVYLDPDAAYAVAQKLARSQGSNIPIAQNTLWKRLAQRKILAEVGRDHNTVRKQVGGLRRRVIYLYQEALGFVDAPFDHGEDIEISPVPTNVNRNSDTVEKPVHH